MTDKITGLSVSTTIHNGTGNLDQIRSGDLELELQKFPILEAQKPYPIKTNLQSVKLFCVTN